MRRLIVFAVTLAAVSVAISAARRSLAIRPPADPALVAEAGKPIPQDPEKSAKRSRDRLEFQRRTLQGAYDKIGNRDPRWDKPAREALELAARMFGRQVDPQVHIADVQKPAKAAVDAGCDDPMIIYICERTSGKLGDPITEEKIRRARAWSKGLADSKYPVFRRAIAIKNAADYLQYAVPLTDEIKKEAERGFDAALALLPDSVAQDERDEFWQDQWNQCLSDLIHGFRWVGVPPVAAFERVDAALAKLPELRVLQLEIQGDFWYRYGWEARTTAFAPNVPAGGFQTLGACLDKARKALEESWRLRPDDAWVATQLMGIDKTVGGDRDTMELWFDRAMKADGDWGYACAAKLDWLDPKWHGTDEEQLAFGRACRDTKNWRAGITLFVADAHYRHAGRFRRDDLMKHYMGLPEVWADVESVYTEYLKHYADDNVARSKYAALAFLAGRFAESHAQFEILGDQLVQWPDFPYIPLAGLKQIRADAARQAAAGVKPPDAPKVGPRLD